VGEHAALGSAGRARRVDDRREVGGANHVPALCDDAVADRQAVLDQSGDVARQCPHRPPVGKAAPHGLHLGSQLVGLDEDGDGPGVAEDPLDL
jgi:hypothetical protein